MPIQHKIVIGFQTISFQRDMPRTIKNQTSAVLLTCASAIRTSSQLCSLSTKARFSQLLDLRVEQQENQYVERRLRTELSSSVLDTGLPETELLHRY